jgi:hypothetical protein
VIIPPAAGGVEELASQTSPETPSDELATIEAGWDELLA